MVLLSNDAQFMSNSFYKYALTWLSAKCPMVYAFIWIFYEYISSSRNQEAKMKTILKYTIQFNFHFHVFKANIEHGTYHHSGKYLLFLID